MKHSYFLRLLLAGLLLFGGNFLFAQQEKKVQFNGLGRAVLLNTGINGEIKKQDTTSADRLTDGEFLLDLALNIQPNEKTEIQSILRLRNEFGGFYGAGMSIEVRELFAKGIIGSGVRYHVGDMDLALSPFTLFNPDEEGTVNEPAIFQAQKEIIHYEQFYADGNRRRMQGAKVDFGLIIPAGLETVDASAFFTRIRGTDFFTIPSRYTAGGTAKMTTQTIGKSEVKGVFDLNLVNTWDDLNSGVANNGIRNLVYSLGFDIRLLNKEKVGLHFVGETGRSVVKTKVDSVETFKADDSFLKAGIALDLKPHGLRFELGYVDIGPDFFSMGAQSKRIDFERTKTFYNRIGNERFIRMPGLFDISRDRALYTFQLSDRLMTYDPRLANVLPYGEATPNRRGLRLEAGWICPKGMADARIEGAMLNEIRGQGTNQLKQFLLLRAIGNLNVNKLIDTKRNLKLTFGYQLENTNRDGELVEQVDMTSHLLDAGIEAEVFTRFDLLFGAKVLFAKGTEYVPEIEKLNIVKDFPGAFVADDTESLIGAGFRYRFREDIYLTLQYQSFSFSRETNPANDYRIGQAFVIYNMNF